MNTPFLRSNERGITRFQVFVSASLIAVIGYLVFGVIIPGITYDRYPRIREQLNNGRQIYLSMRNYAYEMDHGGAFPTFVNPKDQAGLFMSSNEAFEILLPRYLDDKRPFFNKNSTWCKTTPKSEATAYKVQPGENDWCYVRGLRDNSNSRWPLLANAFAPNTTTYVKDQSQRGGVWKGANAIVVWAGGSAEIVETKEADNGFFVQRSDNPKLDAFQKDGEWLTGENVEVLYPKSN